LIIAFIIVSWLDAALGLGGSVDRYTVRGPGTFAAGYQSHGGWLTLLLALGTIIPTIAVGVRRLHDVDKSGWWILLSLIPLIGGLILLFFYVQPGTPGPNRFGPDPLAGEIVSNLG
jgi:uncharacterized membrane protein YhaH (DUF805 family)